LPHQSIARSPLGEMHVDVAYEELPPEHTGIARDQPKWGVTPPRARLRFSVELSTAPSCRRIRVRDWADGADPVSRVEPTRSARGLPGDGPMFAAAI
jgi:hypothetical protein